MKMKADTQVNSNDNITTCCSEGERGMALVAVMLIMALMVMLALGVTFTAVSDKAITANFQNLTSGLYAAEAGINNLHRLIRSDRFILASLPDPPNVSPGEPTLKPSDFIVAAEQALSKKEVFPNLSAYKTTVKIKEFKTPYPVTDKNPSHSGSRVRYINPLYPRYGQVEPYSVSY